MKRKARPRRIYASAKKRSIPIEVLKNLYVGLAFFFAFLVGLIVVSLFLRQACSGILGALVGRDSQLYFPLLLGISFGGPVSALFAFWAFEAAYEGWDSGEKGRKHRWYGQPFALAADSVAWLAQKVSPRSIRGRQPSLAYCILVGLFVFTLFEGIMIVALTYFVQNYC